ncbi:MAG: hypothetical protein L6R39_002001 [Caloplaca ligustica]|nr:MAG: hypothetical protein L6R39_002001 [Caloplaca ligustica]
MRGLYNVYSLLGPLILIESAVQVNVVFHNTFNNHLRIAIRTGCENLQPGVCCIHPQSREAWNGATQVTVEHLTALDIAALWEQSVRGWGIAQEVVQSDCSAMTLASRPGPGTWRWDAGDVDFWERGRVVGASYITVPQTLPPDPTAISWMLIEGLLALGWGGGSWFASPAASRLLDRGSGKVTPRRKVRRDVRSRETGQLYARSPPRAVYPNFVEFEGTRYTGNGSAGLIFSDGAGHVVNLTDLLISNKV